MNKFTAACCCLMLAVAPPVMAQGKSPEKKAEAPTTKGIAEKQKKAQVEKTAKCAKKARESNLKHGTREYGQFVSQCLKG